MPGSGPSSRPPCQAERRLSKADLGKSSFEGNATEIGVALDEAGFFLKHLAAWLRPRRVRTPLIHFPASSSVTPEPYGVSLILSPWNYPLLLTASPLIGCMAAGTCAVVKPSAYAVATSALLAAVNRRPKPLALDFSENRAHQPRVLREISFVGGCINGTLSHIATPYLPFGGVGSSGLGSFHGRASFATFSHYQSVLRKSNLLELMTRCPPYRDKLRRVRKVLK